MNFLIPIACSQAPSSSSEGKVGPSLQNKKLWGAYTNRIPFDEDAIGDWSGQS